MSRKVVSTERSLGYYITVMVACALIAGIFLWPLAFSPSISVTDLPSIIVFFLITMFALLGCGLPSRERPHFQFHYHGEKFPVMNEIEDEIMN